MEKLITKMSILDSTSDSIKRQTENTLLRMNQLLYGPMDEHFAKQNAEIKQDAEFITWYETFTGKQCPDDFLDKPYKYYRQWKRCQECNGYYEYNPCNKEIIQWQDNQFSTTKCEKVIDYQKQKLYDERIAQANIPGLYKDLSFDNYVPQNESQRKALAKCKDCEIGLFICGPVGTGKTHLAIAMLRDYCESGIPDFLTRPAYFARTIEILHRLRPPYNDTDLMEMLEKVSFLVLDDLGVQKDSQWTYEQITYLLDTRLINEKQTVITSNLTIEALAKDNIEGERIVSRIKQMCDILLITGGDYRDKIARDRKHPTKVLS